MEVVRIQQNETERIEGYFVNTASTPLSGLTPSLTIRRQSDNNFLTAGQDFTSIFTQVTMSAVGTGTLAGYYEFTFNTSGLADATYSLIASGTGAGNSPLSGELKVGGFIDNLDKPISNIDVGGTVVRLDGIFTKREKDRLFDLLIKNFEELIQRIEFVATQLEATQSRLGSLESKQDHTDK